MKYPKPWRVVRDPEAGWAVEAANGELAARFFRTRELAERRIARGFTDRQFQHRVTRVAS